MRVIVAQHPAPAAPRRLMRGEQCKRVDLEMNTAVRGHVRSRLGDLDPLGPIAFDTAQKQAAAFLIPGFLGFIAQCGQNATCHLDFHPQIVPAMGLKSNIIEGRTGAPGGRLDKALADASGLSRERIKALMGEGRISLAGAPVSSASSKVEPGTVFTIEVPEAAPAHAVAQDIPLSVVFEDEYLIVIDKPAGLVVHPAAGNLDGTLVNALLHHCRGQLSGIGGVARPGIVHRIDKDTSGLLVVAKTDKAHEGLAVQFADHSIVRAYLAVVGGRPVPSARTVTGSIARSNHDRKKMALVEDGRGKHAVTHFRTLELMNGSTLIECRLETGRTHQVRVHMASIGHALLGDPVYGRTPSSLRAVLQRLDFRRQALHAAELGFVHPVKGETVHFTSPLPDDMRTLIDELRN